MTADDLLITTERLDLHTVLPALVDEVAVAHMATEHEILAELSPRQRAELAMLLRIPLLTLGDDAPL